MKEWQKRFLVRTAVAFVFVFLIMSAIVTVLPGCFWLALGIYLACGSGSWLAVTVALIVVSIVIALAWATIAHWRD